MVYKLLIINMEGALLSSKGKLHTHTRESVEYVAKKGVEVVLLTAGNYDSAFRTGKALKCNPHIIAHQGGYITENLKRPLFVRRISEEVTFDTVRFLEKFSGHIRLIHEDGTLANRSDLPTPLFSRIKWTLGDTTLYSQHYVDSLYDHLSKKPMSPLQIDVYIQNQQDRSDAKAGLMAMFDDIVIKDDGVGKLVMLPESVTKHRALTYLLHQRKIAAKEVVMVGHDLDEIEMIRQAGLGVAVANAAIEVKKAANWITRSNDELGVAYLIKEVFRRQHPLGFLKKMNINVD